MKSEILVVDDDRLLLKTLSSLLEEAGYAVRTASNGAAAVAAVRERRPDLVLLDVMMPGRDGLAVCRELRASDPGLLIAFLTALDAPQDEIRGLACGGDVYVSKTVPDDVLLARIAALLRMKGDGDSFSGDFDFGACRVEAANLRLVVPRRSAKSLSDREVALLRLLASRPGAVFDRDAIFSHLWGIEADAADNRLSVLVYELRRKLGTSARALATVRYGGYSYRP